MKTTFFQKQRAIVLPATLCVVLILAIILAAYNSLVNNRNSAVVRSQQWNQAIPVLESGIEEALTQLHYAGTNSTLLTGNNWTYGADGLYHKSRTNTDGTFYGVSIQAADFPVILSTGWVPVMGMSGTINRRVRCVTTPQRPGGGGLDAKLGIITGKTTIDSFNSATAPGGIYSPSVAQSNVLILTDGTNANVVQLNGTLDGSVSTGPGGSVQGSNNATGTIQNDANVQFNDVSAPFDPSTGMTLPGGSFSTTNGTTNEFIDVKLPGNYYSSAISLSGNQVMVIEANCTIYVNGGFSSNTGVYIAPGVSVSFYINGNVNVGGSGIINAGQLASECTIYGMPNCLKVKIAGTGDYIGTLFTPDADVTITGGGNVIGAMTANSINFNGNGAFHYDEAILPPITNYVVKTWNEF